MILKGSAYATGDPNIIYQADLNNIKVIDLDEDGILMDHDSIIGGTCLLPPMEAKIAEADGNEPLYDTIYCNHLLEPYQQQFVGALLAYMYKGGNLLFFIPELGCTNTTEKFIFHMYERYGIHIGLIGANNPMLANWYYDEKCIPIWMNMIYSSHVISGYEYLVMYPIDAPIQNNNVLQNLIYEFNPYGKSINEQVDYILRLHKQIHKNPNIKQAIGNIRRN